MASDLLTLRRGAGFRSAREFAEEMDIPLPTYSRYEANPDKIPLKAAWAIADRLNCPIDVVVGRRALDDPDEFKGDVQREYDALSPEGRELFDEFREFVRHKEQGRRAERRSEERQRYDQLCRQYERLMLQEREGDAAFGDLVAFGSPEQRRGELERFIRRRAEEKRAYEDGDPQELAERDEDTVARIMEAYDRRTRDDAASVRLDADAIREGRGYVLRLLRELEGRDREGRG